MCVCLTVWFEHVCNYDRMFHQVANGGTRKSKDFRPLPSTPPQARAIKKEKKNVLKVKKGWEMWTYKGEMFRASNESWNNERQGCRGGETEGEGLRADREGRKLQAERLHNREKWGKMCQADCLFDSGWRQERVSGRALWVELNTEKALGRASKWEAVRDRLRWRGWGVWSRMSKSARCLRQHVLSLARVL